MGGGALGAHFSLGGGPLPPVEPPLKISKKKLWTHFDKIFGGWGVAKRTIGFYGGDPDNGWDPGWIQIRVFFKGWFVEIFGWVGRA